MIHDIAAGGNPQRLAADVRKRQTPEGRTRLAGLIPAQSGLVFLAEEPRAPFHFGAGEDVSRIRRYRVGRANRDVYLTLFLAKDGTVLRYTSVQETR